VNSFPDRPTIGSREDIKRLFQRIIETSIVQIYKCDSTCQLTNAKVTTELPMETEMTAR